MSQVTVSEYVKDQLIVVQTKEEHTSIDSVIRMLLLHSDYVDRKSDSKGKPTHAPMSDRLYGAMHGGSKQLRKVRSQ